MKRLILTAFAFATLTSSAMAMTTDQCSTSWKQADVNGDGVLTGAESERFGAMLRVAGKTVGADGSITEAMFRENCDANVFDTMAADDKAPLEGSNSFTEAQAIDRVIAFGLTGVSGLTKDEKGVWRGTGSKDGKNMSVAVDYKGNVVAN